MAAYAKYVAVNSGLNIAMAPKMAGVMEEPRLQPTRTMEFAVLRAPAGT